jgi:predicted DNA binding CopG/RHH family protein
MNKKSKKAIKLDEEEIEIQNAYEKGTIKTRAPSKSLIEAAKATIKKNKNINIRITENDLSSIKMKAAREGLPYQTLIGSLLHKYASGYLKEAG